jgi:hypothetical protein
MADVLAHTSTFARGSGVLEYWLLNAEGFTVEPLGATVERVVVPAPFEPPVALIVQDARGRERVIPAEAIAAVEPLEERLLVDRSSMPRRPRRSPAARMAYAWLRPRAIRAAVAAARYGRHAYAWLRPRVAAAARAVAVEVVRLTRRALRELEARYASRRAPD